MYECTQPATVAGISAELSAFLHATCVARDENEWLCECNGASKSFPMVDVASTWDACTEAVEICQEAGDPRAIIGYK